MPSPQPITTARHPARQPGRRSGLHAASTLAALAVLGSLLAGCAALQGGGGSADPAGAADEARVIAALTAQGFYPQRVPPRTLKLELSTADAFASGSTALPPTMPRTLDALARQLNSPLMTGWRLRVVGHADDRGSLAENDVTSLARAATVVRHFESQGVAPARLQAEGRGEREPEATNAQRYGRELNRRVDLFLEQPQAAAPR